MRPKSQFCLMHTKLEMENVERKNRNFLSYQFVIFKPLNYCFEETIGFDVKASFTSRPVLRLTR